MGENLEKKTNEEIGWRLSEIGFGIFLFTFGELLRQKTEFNYTGGSIEFLSGLYALYHGGKLGKYLSEKFFRR